MPSPEKLGDETALGVVPDNKTPTSFMNEIDHAVVSEERPLFDGDQLVDIRSEAAIFQAGDLVEVRYFAMELHVFLSDIANVADVVYL